VDGVPITFLSLGRFLRDVRTDTSAIDVGGRFVVQPRDDLALGIEYVQRWHVAGPDRAWTYRAAGLVEHRIGEGAYLTATIGKDLDDNGGGLLSLLGLRVDVGEQPQLVLK